MTRLKQFEVTESTGKRRASLQQVQTQLGKVPNLYKAMAASPAALDGYLSLRSNLSSGELSALEREYLALYIAQQNNCGYCVAAHEFRSKRMNLTKKQRLDVRQGRGVDERSNTILNLAGRILKTNGNVSDEELEDAKQAGVGPEVVAEIVGHIALNTMSNFFNHVAQPDLDFPAIETDEVKQ